MANQDLTCRLYQALQTPLGLVVVSSPPEDRERLRQQLYVARRTDPALGCLQLRLGPKPGEIWIVKTDMEQQHK